MNKTNHIHKTKLTVRTTNGEIKEYIVPDGSAIAMPSNYEIINEELTEEDSNGTDR